MIVRKLETIRDVGTFIRTDNGFRITAPEGFVAVDRIKGKIEDLKMFGFKNNESIPGKIVVRESFMPFNLKDSERDLKIAGDTGIICRVDDQPIYRQTFFTYDLNAQDELIAHTNTDEIREVAMASREMSAILSHHERKAAEATL